MKISSRLARMLLPITVLNLSQASEPALKEVFGDAFLIGAAMSTPFFSESMPPQYQAAKQLIPRHFNTITPANLLKWGPYNPEPGIYNTDASEAFIAYGKTQGMHMVGHTLFWHNQTPTWVFENKDGSPVSREVLLERMRERVRMLAARYGDSIQTWDVVNETFMEDGSLRNSPWTRILGDTFVEEAFRIAAEELPAHAELLYNDYNMFQEGKRRATLAMVADLRAKGIRIDGIGMQGHYTLDYPRIADIEASIVAFSKAGLPVHITELDIDVLPRDPSMFGAEVSMRAARTEANDPYQDGLPGEVAQKLAQRYADLFALFLKHQDKISRVTFWGVTDADSWLNGWPVRGRTNHPLIFDRQAQPKAAFDAILEVASE
jgi:endo-1,4-beta-xylanase